ncbi:MAG: NAD(P)-binding domain-containing protein [Desulfobulbaceae bacterium]|nr:NAD(P)-binding domain-containing protein [Desulfobulbaceae bacterium]
MLPTVGFLGSGSLTKFFTKGLCTSEKFKNPVLVSDIDLNQAKNVASKFPKQIRITENSQEMLDNCKIVVLAVRPQHVEQALKGLNFQANHIVLSAIAMITIEKLKSLVLPCSNVIRIMPLPPVQEHLGAIPYFPQNSETRTLLEHLSIPLLMDTEDNFNIITSITALTAPFYTLLNHIKIWATQHNVPSETAQVFILNMFYSLAATCRGSEIDLNEIIEESATPGGLNEQGVKYLIEHNAFEPFKDLLEIILKRLDN